MPVTKRDLLCPCPYCSASPAAFGTIGNAIDTTDLDGGTRRWQVASCPSCGGVLRFEFIPDSETVVRVSPEADTSWEVGYLPDDVETHWKEAISAFRGRNYRSAVVACGRALEAASAKFGLDKGPLFKRIEEMLEDGLITVQFKPAMDYVRVIRNTGAHAGPEVAESEAEGALGFTQQTLRLLFEVPGALAELDHGDGDAEESNE
jgi:hypothetical protein